MSIKIKYIGKINLKFIISMCIVILVFFFYVIIVNFGDIIVNFSYFDQVDCVHICIFVFLFQNNFADFYMIVPYSLVYIFNYFIILF